MVARGSVLGRSTLLTAAVASFAALLLTVVVSTVATGADAGRCTTYWLQSQARERIVTGHGPRILVIGDSYAVGLGLRNAGTSWPSSLPGRATVYGFSGSGFSPSASPCPGTSYAARMPGAAAARADLVVLEGGLNDHDQPEADVRAGLRRVLHRIGHDRVLVVGPPEAPHRAAGARRVDALLRSEATRAGVEYLPMTGHRFPYLDDRLHLTGPGHRAFGALVAARIADH